jgi:hypothetical protein
MKNVLKLGLGSLLGLFVLFLLVSCDKTENEVVPRSLPASLSEYSNDCNAYDYYGELHNQGLDYIMAFEEEIIALGESSVDEMQDFIIQHAEEFVSTLEIEGDDGLGAGGYDWDWFFSVDFNNYAEGLAQTSLTAHEQGVLVNYFDQFANYDFEDPESVASFIAYSDDLACSLQDDPEIINDAAVFAAISTGGHSASFWLGYNQNGGMMSLRKIDWRFVAGADAFGAARGIVGGPAFILTGALASSAFSIGAQTIFSDPV